MIGIKLAKHKSISCQNDVIEYLKPDYIYIPLISANDKDVVELVKVGDKVKKGQIVGRRNKFDLPIFSSVSGLVVAFEDHMCFNGSMVKTIKIKNDFKELLFYDDTECNINDYSKEEFIDKIKEAGIIGLGGAGFPTYIKYNTDKKIRTLIVNAVECEPYITADYMLIKNHIKEIIECINAIMGICSIDECYIAIKGKNRYLKERISTEIAMYKNIRLSQTPNLYPMGWERSLVRYIKHTDYNVLPIEKGIVINNVATIYSIYEALKYNKPLIERYITITGEALKQPTNIFCKVGVKIDEVIASINGYNCSNLLLLSGGPMMGNTVNEDIVVSPNLNCVVALKNTLVDDELTCLRCGKCSDNCPMKLSPVLIKDNINFKENLKRYEVNKCIECGICSYTCPSKINLREYVKKAKEIGKE